MANLTSGVKRLLVGRAMHTERLGHTLLPKRIALPVFASDALSSVAYAPDEIFLTLSIGGLAAYSYSWKIGILVAVVMLTVVASYRQNVHAYPSGGGDYEVATVNLGRQFGVLVASALLVDYVLTVAVSVSSGVKNGAAAIPALHGHEVTLAVVVVLLLMAMNLRGIRESGTMFAIPTYVFMVGVLGMAGYGFYRYFTGDLPMAESAQLELVPEGEFVGGASALAMTFLVMRAFSSGSAALTGVEAVSNGVPAFRVPKSKNAATTLLLLGSIAVAMLLSIIALANVMHLRYAESPGSQLLRDGVPVGSSYEQNTVIGQLAAGVFDQVPLLFYLVTGATAVILFLAANTAFNGFPVLGSVLAGDGWLPRQLHTRGDRLAFSNGIILLALFAVALIIGFDAETSRLIQLYIVGVFVSFTLSQIGMVRHWNRLLATVESVSARKRMHRARAVSAFGASMTGTVLAIVLITKFTRGAWITLLAMAALVLLMRGIHRHYASVAAELRSDDESVILPARVHAVVLVSKLHKPALRAIAYARASRSATLEAVTVNVDPADTEALLAEWERARIPVILKVLDSPFREITRPVLEYVRQLRAERPRDIVDVYVPEYVVGHWWENLLHNQSALRLKTRLRLTPGVVVVSVPYQLRSSQRLVGVPEGLAPGAYRRGEGADTREPETAIDEVASS